MSSLSRVEERALSALDRIERALRERAGGATAPEADAAERARLEEERERLRQERDALRREVAVLRARHDRLAAVVDEVGARLEGAIGRIDDLAGE